MEGEMKVVLSLVVSTGNVSPPHRAMLVCPVGIPAYLACFVITGQTVDAACNC